MKLLVATRDVVDDVPVVHETVRGEEVLESSAKISLGVALRTELEVELRFVGEIVGPCRIGNRGDEENEQDDGDAPQEWGHGGARLELFSRWYVQRRGGAVFHAKCHPTVRGNPGFFGGRLVCPTRTRMWVRG